MSKHYRYGGSTASRTINCPGWRSLADTLPEQDSSKDADRGSMLHNCMEKLVLGPKLDFYDLLDMNIEFNGFKLDKELLETKVLPALGSCAHRIAREEPASPPVRTPPAGSRAGPVARRPPPPRGHRRQPAPVLLPGTGLAPAPAPGHRTR